MAGLVPFLRKVPLFEGLRDTELEEIAALAQRKSLKKNAFVVMSGEPGTAMYVILKGSVKVTLVSRDGREMILAILKAGETFGEMSLLDAEAKRSADVVTLEPSEVLVLYRDDFLHYAQQNPRVLLNMARMLARRLRETDERLSSLVFLDVAGRVARYFLEVAREEGRRAPEGVLIPRTLKIEELAQFLGCSRETISRALKFLRQKGLIENRKDGVLLKSYEALEEMTHP